MLSFHPDLRQGIAQEHIDRLAVDRLTPRSVPSLRRRVAALLLVASERLAGTDHSAASSASFTSLSASSLCSRRTAV
jgi:hypothetical protein